MSVFLNNAVGENNEVKKSIDKDKEQPYSQSIDTYIIYNFNVCPEVQRFILAEGLSIVK